MKLGTDVSYTGRGWYRRNAAFITVGGIVLAFVTTWWIGILVALGGLATFAMSELLLPFFARRRAGSFEPKTGGDPR